MSLEGRRRAAMTETGSNDTKRVVWAVGMSFFSSFTY